MTKHPPHALMNSKSNSDRISVMKIMDNDIGHVAFKSAIDSSQKPIPKFIVYAIASFVGQQTPTNYIVEQLPKLLQSVMLLSSMH